MMDEYDDMTQDALEHEYAIINEEFDNVFSKFKAVRNDFRAGKCGYDEFLEERAKYDLVKIKFDKIFEALS